MAIQNTIQTALNGAYWTTYEGAYDASTYANLSTETGFFTINSNGFTTVSRTDLAPAIAPYDYFVPEQRRYKITYTVRKLTTGSNTAVGASWFRPTFLGWTNTSDTSVNQYGTLFGYGVTDNGVMIDTKNWIIGQDYEIGSIATFGTDVIRAKPRVRINRNSADASPYSDATYLITKAKMDIEVKFSELRNEFINNIEQSTIFNTWGRWNGPAFYPAGSTIPPGDDAASWVYVDGVIKSTVNSAYPIGFVSPNKVTGYDFTATVGSTDGDDDIIGLILAFDVIGGVPHSIIASRAVKGSNVGEAWSIAQYVGATKTILVNGDATISSGGVGAGWWSSGAASYGKIKLNATRDGNQLIIKTSQTTGVTGGGPNDYDPLTILTYDIPSDSPLYNSPSSFGYFAYSQAGAYFENSEFIELNSPMAFSDIYRVSQITKGDGYYVDNDTDFNAVVSSLSNIVVDQSNVFNSWARFGNGSVIYTNVAAIPAGDEAASWSYNSTTNQVVSTINSSWPIGFISPTQYINYTHQATVSSTNADDDMIGLVVASYNNGGVAKNLVLWRTQAGQSPTWGFVDITANSTNVLRSILVNGSSKIAEVHQNQANTAASNTNQGWASYGPSTIRVSRSGSSIKAWASQRNNSVVDTSTLIEYEIPSDSVYHDALPYGYMAYSQAQSSFSNISFQGGLNDYVVYSNTVYQKSGNTFVANLALTPQDVLGHPRIISNPLTHKVFSIKENEHVDDWTKNARVPLTGQISLSSFYGSENNDAPVFAVTSLANTTAGASILVPLGVTDTSGQTVSYSLANAPAGLSVLSNGVLTGAVSSSGTYSFTVYAYNYNKVASQIYTLIVN